MYLKSIIHELGMELHSTATCSKLHCFQYGLFNLNHALLTKNWNLNNILNSIEFCGGLLRKNKFLLKQVYPTLIDPNHSMQIEKENEDLSSLESQEHPALIMQEKQA